MKGINRDEKHGLWKGDKVGKQALHRWVEVRLPKEKCIDCGAIENLDLANVSGKYRRDLADWKVQCRRCHMTEDGRMEKLKSNGGRITNAKVTEKQVTAIRRDKTKGMSLDELATKYGLSNSGVQKIVYWTSWKHVGEALTHEKERIALHKFKMADMVEDSLIGAEVIY